jgi:hypothetical protein
MNNYPTRAAEVLDEPDRKKAERLLYDLVMDARHEERVRALREMALLSRRERRAGESILEMR